MIEKLPDVPFREIWRRLSYEDRCSLRRACKQLKSLVDRQIPQNLFLFLECYPCHQILFYSGEMVYYADSCRVIDFDRFVSNRYLEKFRRVKKLAIFFEGLYRLNSYSNKFHWDWESLEGEKFFQEAWHLEVDLEHLNAFEHVEHLEIGEISRVTGQLRLKNLKVLSVETRYLSKFDLDCPQLRAMCISYGARPNFIDHPHPLDYLSIKWIISEDIFLYLFKLFAQCPNLSTIGAVVPHLLQLILKGVNEGQNSLPFLGVIKFEQSQYFLDEKLADCLIEFKQSIEPDDLRIFFNNEPLTFEKLLSIIHLHGKFSVKPDEERTVSTYLDLYEENKSLAGLGCLFWIINDMKIENESQMPDEDLVLKMKHLKELYIESESPPIDERIFRMMMTTWTRMQVLLIADPVGQVGQHLLEQMPGYCPNLKDLTIHKIPEDLKFVAKFKNLMSLRLAFSLAREETMFLMQTCPSLHHVQFRNDETKFDTFLRVKTFVRQSCPAAGLTFVKEIFRKQYSFEQREADKEFPNRFYGNFSSLQGLINYYYDNKFFDKPFYIKS